MSEVKNIPRLRFPEFHSPWKNYTIQELLDDKSITGHLDGNHGSLYPSSNEFTDEGIPYLTATDIVNNKINPELSKKLPIERALRFKKGISKNGDILFAHNATVGPVCLLQTNHNFVILSTTLTYYRLDDKKIIPEFLLNTFQSKYFISQYSKVMSQSTRNQVPITQQRKFNIFLTSLPEQQKIADFLTAVDQRIELLEKKKTLLETYKKGVMKKIFNQEIRFKNENGDDFPDWEEKRLDEISKIYQPKTISQNQFTENGYVVYGANGPIGFYSEYNHETPQVVVTCRGNSCGTVNITTPKSWITGNGMVVNVDDNPKVFKDFIYFYLVNDNLTYLITGSGQPQITGDLKNHKINIPTEIEQVKISKFLSSIDQQLELLGTQIDKSKTWKKGLLQKMFV